MAMLRRLLTVNAQTALNHVSAVVSGREDFTYSPPEGSDRCLYAHGDSPGCLVGQVLNRLGVSVDDLRDFDASNQGAGALYRIVFTMADLGGETVALTFTREAAALLGEAQRLQDDRRPWGAALEAATERFRLSSQADGGLS